MILIIRMTGGKAYNILGVYDSLYKAREDMLKKSWGDHSCYYGYMEYFTNKWSDGPQTLRLFPRMSSSGEFELWDKCKAKTLWEKLCQKIDPANFTLRKRNASTVSEYERLMPLEPTDRMWSGLARDIMAFLLMGAPHYGSKLHAHLKMLGHELPDWFEEEIPNIDHTPAKGDFLVAIYKAMIAEVKV